MVCQLLAELVTAHRDLLRVDDDDEVTHVHVCCNSGLVLTAEEDGSVRGKATENDIGCINYMPLTINIARLGAKRAHAEPLLSDLVLEPGLTNLSGTDTVRKSGAMAPFGDRRARLPALEQKGQSGRVGLPGFPDWLGALANHPILPEDQKTVEGAGKPAIVGHRDDRALEAFEAIFERLCARQVEVIGRLIKE